jgi:hypothetical protein
MLFAMRYSSLRVSRLFVSLVLVSTATLTIATSAEARRSPKSRIPQKQPPVVTNTTTSTMPTIPRPSFSNTDKPFCYAQMTGKGMLNLDKLCGVDRKSDVIDLSIDADGDGVSDQLLVVMRTFNKAMSNAKTQPEYEAALQGLESRMPYSDNVKRLQAQQRDLQKQLVNIKDETKGQALYRQLSTVQEQIYKDSSYTKVQEAMSKTYSKLN